MDCKIISLKQLYFSDFYIGDAYAMRQKWMRDTLFHMRLPRKRTAVIFLNNCTALYTDKTGEHFFAPRKSVVCLPQGSEYTCRNMDCTGTFGDAILVEFVAKSDQEVLTFSDKPFLIKDVNATIAENLFLRVVQAYETSILSPLAVKASVYALLSFLCEAKVKKYHQRFAVIAPGIEAIESDPLSDTSIEQIARTCNMTSSYFRRLFKEYAGKSPNEYRMDLRFRMAKRMLENGDATLYYIAEALGFESAAYFCKIFKKKFGMTPGEYRNNKTIRTE